ncbi:MAG TPA: multicopper oxidase [Thermoplasmata archaeon]
MDKTISADTVRRGSLRSQSESMKGWKHAKVGLVSLLMVALLLPFVTSIPAAPPAMNPPGTIDPLTIPKYVNELTGSPPVYKPFNVTDDDGNLLWQEFTVYMDDDIEGQPIYQQILPSGFPKTQVWGYGGTVYSAESEDGVYSISAPGASFEAVKGVPIHVKWVNNIDGNHMFPVDPTLHWANPNYPLFPDAHDLMMHPEMYPDFPTYPPGFTTETGWPASAQWPVPAVPHLHGSEVSSWYDGGPDAWFTYDGKFGPSYSFDGAPEDLIQGENAVLYKYPNEQPATTLWYHDHALGITRINVMSGLAGFYLLRDSADPIAPLLPNGTHEVPLVIQDRTFNLDGSFWFDTVGLNPEHPYWTPEFFGNTVMVNGLVWPNMKVDQGLYRFRMLDGSNARFYSLSFSNGMPFTVIGSDGGYLRAPAPVTKLTIAPGERYDILVDFRGIPAGTKVLLLNSAKAPFPNGAPALGNSVGQIMQFEVTGTQGPVAATIPAILNQDLATAFPSLDPMTVTNRRQLTLTEVMGPGGPLEILLDGLKWNFPVTEKPTLGTTEQWVIVNPTADTHPIHLHLVQFQLVSRQRFDAARYLADWEALNAPKSMHGDGMAPYDSQPENLDLAKYLKSNPKPAANVEQGWKDTVQMNPGEVTIIRVRFAPISSAEVTAYPFDATEGPGYVWHCHIIDHEDNEMMRPYKVEAAVQLEL